MPTIQCPHCSHEARVPSLEQIVGKNVKCPSCSQTFHVQAEAPAPAVNADNDFNFQAPAPPSSSPPSHSTSASMSSRRRESLFKPLTYDANGATSAHRYPNLMRYIAISETLITLLFKICMGLIVIGFLFGEVMAVFYIGEFGLGRGLLLMVLLVISAALNTLFLWLWFICYMAITEFVRVVVDIENNTRGQHN